MIFDTWNVQGISRSILNFNLDVCALCEKRNFIHIYNGVPKEKRACAGWISGHKEKA